MNRALADGTDTLALAPAPSSARAWLFALVVGLPMVLVGISALGGSQTADATVAWRALGGTTLFCLLVWAMLAALLGRHRLAFDASGMEIATTFYRRHFTPAELDLDAARVVDLGERPEYRPMLRTNGIGLPGFRSGWYRLRNGNRALVAVAAGQRLLWIPTRAGHDLLLQPRDPHALLERLRATPASRSGH